MKDGTLKRYLLNIYYRYLDIKQRVTLKKEDIIFCIKHPIIKNKVVFDNFAGNGYGENPKFIAEEIHNQGLNWELVWLVENEKTEMPQYIRKVKYGSEEAIIETATAKVLVDNIRNSKRYKKRRRQIYLQTWHGGFGPKKVEAEIENQLSPYYLEKAKLDGRNCDAIISSCAIQTNQYKNSFWLDKRTEILEYGQPKTDILFSNKTEEIRRKVLSILNIDLNTKVILYAPTFRDDGSIVGYNLDFIKIINCFEKKYRKNFVLVIRLHPNARKLCDFIIYNNKIINGTVYPDIGELLIAADFMITDFSSVAFDITLIHKPVFLCILDYDSYCLKRDLNNYFFEAPFPQARTMEELITVIFNFSEYNYWKQIEDFKKKWMPFDDGSSSKRVVEWLRNRIT